MRERSAPIDASGRWIRTGGRIVVLVDQPAADVDQELSASPAVSPRDVLDARIDPCAQFALLRLGRSGADGRAAALGLLAGVKSGQLTGIYGENLLASARLAAKLNTVWWKLLPLGEDAALIVDPQDPLTAPAAIVFRSTQGRATKPGDPQACLSSFRLDSALRRVWARVQLLQSASLAWSEASGGTISPEYEGFGPTVPASIVPPLSAEVDPFNKDVSRWIKLEPRSVALNAPNVRKMTLTHSPVIAWNASAEQMLVANVRPGDKHLVFNCHGFAWRQNFQTAHLSIGTVVHLGNVGAFGRIAGRVGVIWISACNILSSTTGEEFCKAMAKQARAYVVAPTFSVTQNVRQNHVEDTAGAMWKYINPAGEYVARSAFIALGTQLGFAYQPKRK